MRKQQHFVAKYLHGNDVDISNIPDCIQWILIAICSTTKKGIYLSHADHFNGMGLNKSGMS